MTLGVLDQSDRLWRGEMRIEDAHPASTMAQGVFPWTAAQAEAFTPGA